MAKRAFEADGLHEAGTGPCVFCRIIGGETEANLIHSDAETVSFLDHSPLFPGHVLVVPRIHHVTLPDLPPALLAPLFGHARRLARGMEDALGMDGSFLAVNNRVSQSVKHLHVHVVPRRRGDGMKGFFWPRRDYADEFERGEMARLLQEFMAANPG
ncbi:MAG: HIT family protein [Fibrobacteria bacterium]